jgi:acyl carrier protein
MSARVPYEQIERECAEIIAAKLGTEPGHVRPEARLGDDLGLDSVDIVGVMMEIEERFPASIPNDAPEADSLLSDILRMRLKDLAMILYRYQGQ